jgi:hypothetical protein
MPGARWVTRLYVVRPGLFLAAFLGAVMLVLANRVPIATADEHHREVRPTAARTPRISSADPLNGSLVLVNNHGMLFHPDNSDIQEDVAYARWLGSGIIRVFATDSNSSLDWDGRRVGQRIAEVAPILRSAHARLIVALVNNHQAVPRELSDSIGWMDNYMQLLQPFYVTNWRGAYLQFMRELVDTVRSQGAQDVIYAWELGNELHSPRQPDALAPFIMDAVQELRALDPDTPILPGTMGANHIQPGNPRSPIARWLYCDAPIDGYTLHAYDWVSRERPGDMPIDWDLDNITSEPCPNGRALPVIVEELGTSRTLAGVYSEHDESGRLEQELRQINLVRSFPQVVSFGVWNGQSPRLDDRTFIDTRRGLTSYGSNGQGGGSCYDPAPDRSPSTRCQLEEVLRSLTSVRVDASEWTPMEGTPANTAGHLVGSVDPVYGGESGLGLGISGWVVDPLAIDSTGVERVEVLLQANEMGSPLAIAEVGLPRKDVPAELQDSGWRDAGFRLSIPLERVPVGATRLVLAAHTREHGTWLATLHVVVPMLGPIPYAQPKTPVQRTAPTSTAVTPPRAEIQAPQPGDLVTPSFILQLLAPGADRVEVFLEPGRDRGGRLVGSVSSAQARAADPNIRMTVVVPTGSHTLEVHVQTASATTERILMLPIVVR